MEDRGTGCGDNARGNAIGVDLVGIAWLAYAQLGLKAAGCEKAQSSLVAERLLEREGGIRVFCRRLRTGRAAWSLRG
jgi:hypothetical protein